MRLLLCLGAVILLAACKRDPLLPVKKSVQINAKLESREVGREPADFFEWVYHDAFLVGTVRNKGDKPVERPVIGCYTHSPQDTGTTRTVQVREKTKWLFTIDVGSLEPGEKFEFDELFFHGTDEEGRTRIMYPGSHRMWVVEGWIPGE